MAHYSTKGKRLVAALLEKYPEKQMSAEEIFVALGTEAPGQSRVYRILAALCDDGNARRERRADGDGYRYQYSENLGCDSHFHLKCTECGKVVHLRCHVVDELKEHIFSEHGFIVDSGKTVFYGKCAECGGAK